MLQHKVCQYCGKEFSVYSQKGKNSRFCSFKCWCAYEAEHKSRVTLICEFCGKNYEVIPARVKKSRFCSKECIHAYLAASKKGKNRSIDERWQISNGHRLRWQILKENPELPEAKEAFRHLEEMRPKSHTRKNKVKNSSRRMHFNHSYFVEKEITPMMHDLIFDYVIRNPGEFCYSEVYIYQGTNFDMIGITFNGQVERIEIERSAYHFLGWHDSKECDRVIAYHGTKKALDVPLSLVNKKKFIEFAEAFFNLLKKNNVPVYPHLKRQAKIIKETSPITI